MRRRRAAMGLVGAGLTVGVLWITNNATQASSPGACGTGGWARRAAAPASLGGAGPMSVRVTSGRGRWTITLSPGPNGQVAGRVSADSALEVVRADAAIRAALHRSVRGFSFRLDGARARQRLVFRASCARKLSFAFNADHVALGKHPAPTPAFELQRPPLTGLAGRTVAGPTCPVVSPGCAPAKPVQSTVRVYTAPATRSSGPGRYVKSVPTDANGSFSTTLPPGNYLVYAQSSSAGTQTSSGSSQSSSVPVEVAGGVVSDVVVAFDTGIR